MRVIILEESFTAYGGLSVDENRACFTVALLLADTMGEHDGRVVMGNAPGCNTKTQLSMRDSLASADSVRLSNLVRNTL